jgi:carbonic anhydrase/acetyltransferase-like protein (isoleucine patch superfamily)
MEDFMLTIIDYDLKIMEILVEKMIGKLGSYQPIIEASAFVAPTAVIIGRVTIGGNSVIWFNVIIRGGIENEITIGERTIIEDNCVIHGTAPIHVGNNVIIGHNSIIHSCIIEDYVLIAPNVCIYDEAHIKKGVMIGNNSVVQPKTIIEPEIFVSGSPVVKKVKKTKVDLERNKKYIDRSIAHAQEFKKNFVVI